MKICFNIFPPTNKLIAILVCMLLILSYTRLKAEKRLNNFNNTVLIFKQACIKNTDAKINSVAEKNQESLALK